MADDAPGSRPFEALPPPVLHSVAARDGWILRVWDFSPSTAGRPRATIIAGHAMLVDSRTVCRPDRPTIASVLVAAGFRVLAPDQRGHGQSGPRPSEGGDWTLDDLVGDVGHYVELAQALEPEGPVVLLGHSLFGQASLAWLGQQARTRGEGGQTGAASVAALVLLSSTIWNRRFEPSRLMWWLERLFFWPSVLITALVGYFPGRRLRVGTADEARGFWRQFHGHMRRNAWDALDGTDYFAAIADIDAPVLHVTSEGDRLYARPPMAARVSAPIPQRELLVLGRDDAPGELARLRPNHMGVLTDPRSKLAWHWVAGWIRRALERG